MVMRQLVLVALMTWASGASAQDALDRVLVRVEGQPITLTDARAAIRLGVVETPQSVDPLLSAMRQLTERSLVLAEVARFAPGEPDQPALDAEVRTLVSKAGGREALVELERTTGVGEQQVREIARDNLRIQAYLNQRFGATAQPSEDEVGQYYRTHLDEFRVDGKVLPFVEAEPIARERAAAERRSAMIFQWLRELRQRADVVELYPGR